MMNPHALGPLNRFNNPRQPSEPTRLLQSFTIYPSNSNQSQTGRNPLPINPIVYPPPGPRIVPLHPRFLPDPLKRSIVEEPVSPAISERKLDELQRSLFVPRVPDQLSKEDLASAFREFGNVQELIWIDKETHRCAIIIFVDEESAYDVLRSRFVVEDTPVFCEPRRIAGKNYPPRIPMDADARTIQSIPGGRGVPFSVIADTLPLNFGNSVNGAGDPFAHRSVIAARAPFMPTPKPDYFSRVLNRPPVQLPVIRSGPPIPSASQNAMEKLLRQMPFLRTEQTGVDQMYNLMKFVELNSQELQVREQIRADLEYAFRRIFRSCSVRLYGSSANTFGVKGSDVDAYLELNLDSEEARKDIPVRENGITWYYKNVTQLFKAPYEPAELKKFTKQEILRLMEKLMRYLAKTMGWDEIWSIPEARTPILKLNQTYSGYSVDVSFSSRLVFQNTGLLILYSFMEPRVRPLVYAVRKWADLKNLTGDRGFTKYALTMLVLFFLHRAGVLPTPYQIIVYMENYLKETFKEKDGKDCSFDFDHPPRELQHIATNILPATDNSKSVADLLIEFFHFYAPFPFCENVMDGLTGSVVPIEKFENPDEEFRIRYINFQDPFDRAHNIAKTVIITTFLVFRETLKRECVIFSQQPLDLRILFQQSSEFNSNQPVMISISGNKATVAPEIWMPKIAEIIGKIMIEFFCCDFVKELYEEEIANISFDRNILRLGPVLKDYFCHLDNLSWMKRRNERKKLTQKKKYVGIGAEWELECDIGKKIAEGTRGKADLTFYVTVFINNIERDRIGIFLSAEKITPQFVDFFDFLEKYLPEQARRFLKLEEIVVEPGSENDQSSVQNTAGKAEKDNKQEVPVAE